MDSIGKDNVIVLSRSVKKGETIEHDGQSCIAACSIPGGCMMALVNIRTGEICRKDGKSVGTALKDIAAGTFVDASSLHRTDSDDDFWLGICGAE